MLVIALSIYDLDVCSDVCEGSNHGSYRMVKHQILRQCACSRLARQGRNCTLVCDDGIAPGVVRYAGGCIEYHLNCMCDYDGDFVNPVYVPQYKTHSDRTCQNRIICVLRGHHRHRIGVGDAPIFVHKSEVFSYAIEKGRILAYEDQ